jgi:hypothetical protein
MATTRTSLSVKRGVGVGVETNAEIGARICGTGLRRTAKVHTLNTNIATMKIKMPARCRITLYPTPAALSFAD